jgi:hypothetical protein
MLAIATLQSAYATGLTCKLLVSTHGDLGLKARKIAVRILESRRVSAGFAVSLYAQ